MKRKAAILALVLVVVLTLAVALTACNGVKNTAKLTEGLEAAVTRTVVNDRLSAIASDITSASINGYGVVMWQDYDASAGTTYYYLPLGSSSPITSSTSFYSVGGGIYRTGNSTDGYSYYDANGYLRDSDTSATYSGVQLTFSDGTVYNVVNGVAIADNDPFSVSYEEAGTADIIVTSNYRIVGSKIYDKSGNFDVYVSGNGVDWDDKTNTLTGLQANKSYNIAVKFAGNANYEESDVLNITVTTVSKPAASLDREDVEYTVYYNKVVIDVKAEGEFEYSTDNSKWSSSNEITGLEANKEYTVYVRVKASESQEASEPVKITFTTGADPSGINDKLANIGNEITGDNFNDFKDILEEYEKLAEGDKAAIDTEKYEQLKSSYQAFIDTVNADIIAAQNVAKKAAGKGVAAAAAASVIATVIAAAVVAKKKFGF